MSIASIDPVTGETLRSFEPLSRSEVEARIERADLRFREHRRLPLAERARLMLEVANRLNQDQERLARLATLEMGKPIQSAREEVAKCAWACKHVAENAASFFGEERVATQARSSRVRFDPLGVVLAVMPWNFPFWQVFRFAAPALVGGNTALLKHASNVPQCALAIEQVFAEAGFEPGTFTTLLIGADQVPQIIEHPKVRAATLTGSEAAGSDLARRAGAEIKKVVLELGGSDPFIVLPSANLGRAASVAVKARLINNGQSCIAAKRFIVHEAVADEFEARFIAGMSAIRMGNPFEEGTELGPLATRKLRDDLHAQVEASVRAGARLLLGGKVPDGPGHYYPPTVLSGIPKSAPAYGEETFGPVASILRARDLEAAIGIANDTRFGLGSSVWTDDPVEARRCIEDLDAGSVFINAAVASDPRLPFGGTKKSGYGRELGTIGMREFVNVKTVWEDAGEPGRGRAD